MDEPSPPPQDPTGSKAIVAAVSSPTKLRASEAEKDAAIARAIEMASNGEYLTVIAEQLGIPYDRIRLWCISKQPEAYKAAQSKGLAMRIVEADERLAAVEPGPNGFFHLKKADVQCKWTRFDAERRAPNEWAPRQEITGAGGTPLVPDEREIARRWAYLLEAGKPAIEGEATTVQSDSVATATDAGSDGAL